MLVNILLLAFGLVRRGEGLCSYITILYKAYVVGAAVDCTGCLLTLAYGSKC